MEMILVTSLEELQTNAQTLDGYLTGPDAKKTAFVKSLIKHGWNFVIHEVDNEVRFYPSRFMGYVNNTAERHEESKDEIRKGLNHGKTVHGNKTDKRISGLLGNYEDDANMLKEYRKFCQNHEIDISKRFRQKKDKEAKLPKFWVNKTI